MSRRTTRPSFSAACAEPTPAITANPKNTLLEATRAMSGPYTADAPTPQLFRDLCRACQTVDGDGNVLHIGTGYPRLMVATMDSCGGSPHAYAGVVVAYLEERTSNFTRLTDQD